MVDASRSTLAVPAVDDAPSFPLDIWIVIIDIAASNSVDRQSLVPLAQACKALNHLAEEALYHRVSIGPRTRRLRSFLHAVSDSKRRAVAVRSLQIEMPSAVSSTVQPRVLQKPELSGRSSTHAAGTSQAQYSADPRRGNLPELLDEALRRLVNLKVLEYLDYHDVQAFPVVFTSASFQLTELNTTGNVLARATACLPDRSHLDLEALRQCSSPLTSVEILSVDMLDASFHLPMSDLQLRSVTHLCLIRAIWAAIPDLRRGLAVLPNLLSLRIVWSALQGYNYGTSALWPTHVLGDGPLHRLRRLELSEGFIHHPSRPIPEDLNADVDEHLTRLRGLCPTITTLVWWPAYYHRTLVAPAAGSRRQFCEALCRYTERIFVTWPTLERFQRLKLEDSDSVFSTFLRGEGGRISDYPFVFHPDMWRSV